MQKRSNCFSSVAGSAVVAAAVISAPAQVGPRPVFAGKVIDRVEVAPETTGNVIRIAVLPLQATRGSR